jgi:hypothetical protein
VEFILTGRIENVVPFAVLLQPLRRNPARESGRRVLSQAVLLSDSVGPDVATKLGRRPRFGEPVVTAGPAEENRFAGQRPAAI